MLCCPYKMQATALPYSDPKVVVEDRTIARVVEMAVNKSAVVHGVVLALLLGFQFQDVVYARELTEANGC